MVGSFKETFSNNSELFKLGFIDKNSTKCEKFKDKNLAATPCLVYKFEYLASNIHGNNC